MEEFLCKSWQTGYFALHKHICTHHFEKKKKLIPNLCHGRALLQSVSHAELHSWLLFSVCGSCLDSPQMPMRSCSLSAMSLITDPTEAFPAS